MKKSTRRTWARRALRAGWMIAPILAFPSWIKNTFFFENGKFSFGGTFWFLVMLSLVITIPRCTVHMWQLNETATPEQIKEAIKGNWCVKQLLPRRQVHKGELLSVGDVKLAVTDCQAAAEKQTELDKQKAAMGITTPAQVKAIEKILESQGFKK